MLYSTVIWLIYNLMSPNHPQPPHIINPLYINYRIPTNPILLRFLPLLAQGGWMFSSWLMPYNKSSVQISRVMHTTHLKAILLKGLAYLALSVPLTCMHQTLRNYIIIIRHFHIELLKVFGMKLPPTQVVCSFRPSRTMTYQIPTCLTNSKVTPYCHFLSPTTWVCKRITWFPGAWSIWILRINYVATPHCV